MKAAVKREKYTITAALLCVWQSIIYISTNYITKERVILCSAVYIEFTLKILLPPISCLRAPGGVH